MRRRTRLTVAEQREVTLRHGELAALTEHPSWATLLEVVVEEQERIERAIVRAAMRPGGLDQRRVDELRGFVKGLRWFVGTPMHAEHKLDEYLKTHGMQVEGGSA